MGVRARIFVADDVLDFAGWAALCRAHRHGVLLQEAGRCCHACSRGACAFQLKGALRTRLYRSGWKVRSMVR